MPIRNHRVRQAMRLAQAAAERSGVEWLIYNPAKMAQYHQLAKKDASSVVTALECCFPQAHGWIDIGAGSGAFCAEAVRRGHTALALERSRFGRMIARRSGVPTASFSLTRHPPASVVRTFDLALCLEVAEHIPDHLSSSLVRFVAGAAPIAVFTAAPPGQGGTGHINEQPPEYWVQRFADQGALHDEGASTSVARHFEENGVDAPWLVKNVMVFRCSLLWQRG